MEKIKKIFIISSDENLKDILGFCFDGWGYEVHLRDTLVNDITPIKKIAPDVIVIDVYSAKKEDLKICNLLKNDFITAFVPIITLIDKRQLRGQLLSLKQGVDDYLIKPPDPLDLRIRIEMAIKRAHYSFYSSPLTGLPGARIIEEVVKERLKQDRTFSFVYIDIDNFKYFNDVYGYIKGDAVIMQTAYMLYAIIRRFGKRDDFIGHIGGDDFVFITSCDRYKQICQNFIHMFDNIMPFHYSLQDRERGFVIARDRTHKIKKIPLMSASVAVVSRANSTESISMVDINERIAEIKKYLKNIPGSKFMADRRNGRVAESLNPLVYKKEERISRFYKPLGQILLEKKVISSEQLEEALRLHWKRGVVFGEILKELGFLKTRELAEALSNQREILSNTGAKN